MTWREKRLKHDGETRKPGGDETGLSWTAAQVAHCTTLMCAVHGGIRVDVFARTLFQQVAVKHLKEVEPCCTWHKTSSRLAALQCQIPEFHPRAPRASRAQGILDGACSRHEFLLLLSPAHSRVIDGPFTGKRQLAAFQAEPGCF